MSQLRKLWMLNRLPSRNDVRGLRSLGVCLVLIPALMSLISPMTLAEDAEKPAFTPLTRRVLSWLPLDTESVAVGQSFVMPAKLEDGIHFSDSVPSEEAFVAAMSARGLGVFLDLDSKYLKPLAGRKIALALRGNRNFDWVSASLPTHRSESCSIIVFEEKLGDAEKSMTDSLRAGAEDTRKMFGREVFVFPASRQMRRDRAWTWRGTLGIYIVLLDQETLLCATSDTYLEDTLKRIDAKPGRWAIPENLAIWEQIDPRAPAWLVWHPAAVIEKYGGEPLVNGIAWTVTQDQLRAVYLPTEAVAERLERSTRKIWKIGELDVQPKIERLNDEMVVVACSTKNLNTFGQFSLAFVLYQLEAANCPLEDK